MELLKIIDMTTKEFYDDWLNKFFNTLDSYDYNTEIYDHDCWSYVYDCHYTNSVSYLEITGFKNNDSLPKYVSLDLNNKTFIDEFFSDINFYDISQVDCNKLSNIIKDNILSNIEPLTIYDEDNAHSINIKVVFDVVSITYQENQIILNIKWDIQI
jgi:hypothetical protein